MAIKTKNIPLILFGLSTVLACAPKFCRPRKALRCSECSDPDDPYCKKTHMVYCDDEAVQRTYGQYKGNVTEGPLFDAPYLDGKYDYVCYRNPVTVKMKGETTYSRNTTVRGCVRGIAHYIYFDPDDLIEDHNTFPCRCARDYCNNYDELPFSETGEPDKFYSLPYIYQQFDDKGVNLYCPTGIAQPDTTTKP